MSTKSIKLIIIGDSGTGKSTLMQRYVDNKVNFSPGADTSTIGVDFRTHRTIHNNITYTVNIWDTAGQERFLSLSSSFYRMSHCVMIVFDLTDRISFENVINWINRSKQYDATNSKPYVLVGNKCDRAANEIVIKQTEIKEFIDKHNLTYFETSAYNDINVKSAFDHLIEKCIIDVTKVSIPTNITTEPTINLENTTKKTCCK